MFILGDVIVLIIVAIAFKTLSDKQVTKWQDRLKQA